MPRSSVDPMTDYYVLTEEGRLFRRPAFGYDDLMRDLQFNGHKAIEIQLWSEHEARQAAQDQAIKMANSGKIEKLNLLNALRPERKRRKIPG
jgi:hypothetical protein